MTSLEEARETLKENLMEGKAVSCPCCTQTAKIYRRLIHSAMAYALINMHRHGGDDEGWIHLPTLSADTLGEHGADTRKLAYWDLIEPMEGEREDGSTRTGWWRVTDKGREFVLGRIRVGKHARVYNGKVLNIDDTETVNIHDCLGEKFNYDDLMGQ